MSFDSLTLAEAWATPQPRPISPDAFGDRVFWAPALEASAGTWRNAKNQTHPPDGTAPRSTGQDAEATFDRKGSDPGLGNDRRGSTLDRWENSGCRPVSPIEIRKKESKETLASNFSATNIFWENKR